MRSGQFTIEGTPSRRLRALRSATKERRPFFSRHPTPESRHSLRPSRVPSDWRAFSRSLLSLERVGCLLFCTHPRRSFAVNTSLFVFQSLSPSHSFFSPEASLSFLLGCYFAGLRALAAGGGRAPMTAFPGFGIRLHPEHVSTD
jgi:hypothetical protein